MADKQYLQLCRDILENGSLREDRTGTGTLSVFGRQLRFDLSEGFPLLTTKRMPLRIIFEELRWFLSGSTNIKPLLDEGVRIWNADAYRDYLEEERTDDPYEPTMDFMDFVNYAEEYGYDLGLIYGAQWRSWTSAKTSEFGYAGLTLEQNYTETIDQIANVIESIRTNPQSRRHIVSAWNPGELDDMALPPCHVLFQFYVRDGKYLDCQLYQRSGDVFLGVPFNIASYALLTHMIADMTGYLPGEFIHTLGDAHIYTNHIEQVQEQLTREPRELPQLFLTMDDRADPAEYVWGDVILVGYNPHPPIKGKVSVG